MKPASGKPKPGQVQHTPLNLAYLIE
ncbi:hypothetical protein SBA1_1070011 [Candidatus Sulfotelmatobacter kueseliae]|uniref:Uncharacterized protein n=1 Tax=Candidatus Sulfotelmatobacter kueseliae TaxID=2042962 RepID=A0A2U3JZ49_9BACT|nr:hypothetical protein SBA1_1070011 [Candidatus Sulfotelmatobacter kueseliae]